MLKSSDELLAVLRKHGQDVTLVAAIRSAAESDDLDAILPKWLEEKAKMHTIDLPASDRPASASA